MGMPPTHPPTRPGSPGSFWVVGTVPITRALKGEGGVLRKGAPTASPTGKPFSFRPSVCLPLSQPNVALQRGLPG